MYTVAINMTNIWKWSASLKSAHQYLKTKSILSPEHIIIHILRTSDETKWNVYEFSKSMFISLHKYAYTTVFRGIKNYIYTFFLFDWCRTADWKRSCYVAVSATWVHPDRIISRRRSRSGIRQQWQSASEQRGSQRNRSEQGSKRGHSRGTEGNGHSEIQVCFLYFLLFRLFPRTFYFVFLDRQWKVVLFTVFGK